MEILTPTNLLIVVCIIVVYCAITLYRKLHAEAETNYHLRRAQANIMALGRARLEDILENTVRRGRVASLPAIIEQVDETMSINNFLDVYPGLTCRPHVAYQVQDGVVTFTFTAPDLNLQLYYRIPYSVYFRP